MTNHIGTIVDDRDQVWITFLSSWSFNFELFLINGLQQRTFFNERDINYSFLNYLKDLRRLIINLLLYFLPYEC
jgi:hypothetical protein